MQNYRQSLPPLDYLLFFEAVARHKNFTKAAEELNVSQAAVSKRIKVLENWLGMELITRKGRAIELSDHGQKLSASTSEALTYLSQSMIQLRHGTHEKLSLASNISVAQFWLTPQINEYLLGQDASPISLTASDKDADLFHPDHDVIIFYGSDIPTGWEGAILFDQTWVPVVAPGLSNSHDQLPLLDFEKVTPKWITWPDFISQSGFDQFTNQPRVSLGSYGSSLDAAIRGKGIALGCPQVLKYEIEANRLVPLAGFQLATGRSYFAIWRAGTLSQRTRELLRDVGIII